jgi:hypothetical protein
MYEDYFFRIFQSIVLAGLLICSIAASAQEKCPVEKSISESLPKTLLEKLSKGFTTGSCVNVRAVVVLLSQQKRKAGRELEPDRPLDRKAAEAELAKANQDAEYVAALKKDVDAEPDPTRRLVLQAAWLNEFGFFKARDYVLTQVVASVPRD